MKRIWSILLACTLALSCVVLPVNAAEPTESSSVIARVSGRLNHNIPAKTTALLTGEVSLSKDESITYNCTYTPTASVDFGYIDSNDVFHYLNCTSGSINKSIKVGQNGQYTLAIRNNASYAVTVTGTVKY